jgi:hypothetical protein
MGFQRGDGVHIVVHSRLGLLELAPSIGIRKNCVDSDRSFQMQCLCFCVHDGILYCASMLKLNVCEDDVAITGHTETCSVFALLNANKTMLAMIPDVEVRDPVITIVLVSPVKVTL